MSEYVSFYLKDRNGDFLPLASYNRNTSYYEYIKDYAPSYSTIKPLSINSIKDALSDVRNEQKEYYTVIKKYNDKLTLIASMNNPIDEKMEAINDIEDSIKELNNLKGKLDDCERLFIFLIDILEEAECTKYYRDKSRCINPNDYLYAGIECELPDNE